MSRHRGEVLSLGVNSPGVPESPDYYVDVDGKASGNAADFIASDQLFDHTVLKTKTTE